MSEVIMDPNIQLKLLIGGLLIYMSYKYYPSLRDSRRSLNWEKVVAKIILSTFDKEGGQYVPNIVYRYKFKGKEYDNDTYTYLGDNGFTSTWKKNVLRIKESYKEGADIFVFVNPSSPQDSVILPGLHPLQVLMIAVVFLFFSCVFFMYEIIQVLDALSKNT